MLYRQRSRPGHGFLSRITRIRKGSPRARVSGPITDGVIDKLTAQTGRVTLGIGPMMAREGPAIKVEKVREMARKAKREKDTAEVKRAGATNGVIRWIGNARSAIRN